MQLAVLLFSACLHAQCVALVAASVHVTPDGVHARAPYRCRAPRVTPRAEDAVAPARIPVLNRGDSLAELELGNLQRPLSVFTSMDSSRGEIDLTVSWNAVPTQGKGYMVVLRHNPVGKVFVRCSCFFVPDGVTSITVSTVPAGSMSFLQRWLNNCLVTSWYDIEVLKRVTVTALGSSSQSMEVDFVLPSCSAMGCRPSSCRELCRPNHVGNLTVVHINSTAVMVTWTFHPHQHLTLPPITYFGVHYRQAHSTDGGTVLNVEPDKRSIVIANLQPGAQYDFEMNSAIKSRSSEVRKISLAMPTATPR